ncbi:MAG: hypothetical protein FJW34_05745 [Acidobacteria bacterium]|nr:hypothetical protein [Acidobacteriota bacterium]
MPERVYLSLWIRGFHEENMLRHFEQMLRRFPFSRLRPGIDALRVYALEDSEPPALEQLFAGAPSVEAVLGLAREFENPDCAYLVEGWWELFRRQGDWKLAPARVTLCCFGPQFDNGLGDHLRVEFFDEGDFLPHGEGPGRARAVRSNLRGLLRLARELQRALPVERRRLWNEAGADLSSRLDAAVTEEVG